MGDPRWDRVLDEWLLAEPQTEPPSDLEVQEAVLGGFAPPWAGLTLSAPTPPSPGERRVLDVREVAELLRCSRSYVYVLLSSAEIRSLKVGKLTRVPVEAVSEFIDRKLREAGGRDAG